MIGPAVAREGDVGRHSQPRHRAQRWDRQLLIECHQLAHASEVVVADEKDDLVRRVRREPGEEREALTPGALAVVRLAPVEVITHRHELDVRAHAATVAKQPVRVEDAEEPLQGSLGITDGGPDGSTLTAPRGLRPCRRTVGLCLVDRLRYSVHLTSTAVVQRARGYIR